MANLLRGYGLAREQAHFKLEQEADVQRHRQRLVKQGKLPEEAEAAKAAAKGGHQQSGQTFEASEHNYETLAEVLQQQARVDDPHVLCRKGFERRVKGEPAPLSEADLLRARSKIYALGAAVGHVPRVSMGRNRYVPRAAGVGDAGELALASIQQLKPEAWEVASRTYAAGVRALVYGSLLGAVGLAAACTYAVRSSGITSGEELGERMRAALQPLSVSVRSWLLPLKEHAEAWLGPTGPPSHLASSGGAPGVQLKVATTAAAAGGSEGGDGVASEFLRLLQKRYNTRKAAGDGGSGGAKA